MRRRRFVTAAAASAALAPLGARVLSAAPPPTAITPELIEAAKKEGKVTYYTAMDLSVAEPMAKAFEAAGQIGMALERRVLVVIEPGAAQALVVQLKTDRLDQMQVAAAVGAQPDNVAGIRRNFWLKKDDVKHARLRT